jgi:hypothetical protein
VEEATYSERGATLEVSRLGLMKLTHETEPDLMEMTPAQDGVRHLPAQAKEERDPHASTADFQ